VAGANRDAVFGGNVRDVVGMNAIDVKRNNPAVVQARLGAIQAYAVDIRQALVGD